MSITREEIQSVAQKYLSPNQRVEIKYLPGDEVEEAIFVPVPENTNGE